MASLWQKPREMRFGPWLIKARNEILSQQQALFCNPEDQKLFETNSRVTRILCYASMVTPGKFPEATRGHLSCSDVCSVTFTASVVMLQATAGART